MMEDRHAHFDILRQVADSADEEARVRRILGHNLTEADLDAHEAYKRSPFPESLNRAMRCNGGPCKQGRVPCPTPEACQVAEDGIGTFRGLIYALPYALALWAAVALTLWVVLQ